MDRGCVLLLTELQYRRKDEKMNVDELRLHRDELSAQARAIRTGSGGLVGDALADAQREHRSIMQRITQLNNAIRNN